MLSFLLWQVILHVHNSHCIMSNGKMINLKGFGRKQ